MNITFLKGYPDRVGKRETFCGYGIGPTSYSQTTKDPLNFPVFQGYVDFIHSSISVSGTYALRWQPSIGGPRATWKATWIVLSTGNEVANAVNLSAETVMVAGLSGKS